MATPKKVACVVLQGKCAWHPTEKHAWHPGVRRELTRQGHARYAKGVAVKKVERATIARPSRRRGAYPTKREGPVMVRDVKIAGRRSRVISETPISEADSKRLAKGDLDSGDRIRLRALRALLCADVVPATVYPDARRSSVRHVYVHGTEGPVFAFVVWAEKRLAEALGEGACVVEGLSLQVTSGNRLGLDVVRAALGTWFERNFPGSPPIFDVEEWLEPPGELPAEWEPDPRVAEPAFEDAA